MDSQRWQRQRFATGVIRHFKLDPKEGLGGDEGDEREMEDEEEVKVERTRMLRACKLDWESVWYGVCV